MLTTMLLLVAVSVATATDLLRHRIYNWTTYPGILAALAITAAGVDDITLSESLTGLVACGLVMLVCFVMFKIGGGDVKLIAMIGTFLGPEQGIIAMLWTFVLGGCVGLIVLIWRVGALRLIGRTCRQVLYTLRLGRWSPLSDEEKAVLQPPLFLAPCALAAVVIVRFALMDLIS
ncbi:MAG: A24 family peptidase [Thermoguttaceae bacterium]